MSFKYIESINTNVIINIDSVSNDLKVKQRHKEIF